MGICTRRSPSSCVVVMHVAGPSDVFPHARSVRRCSLIFLIRVALETCPFLTWDLRLIFQLWIDLNARIEARKLNRLVHAHVIIVKFVSLREACFFTSLRSAWLFCAKRPIHTTWPLAIGLRN